MKHYYQLPAKTNSIEDVTNTMPWGLGEAVMVIWLQDRVLRKSPYAINTRILILEYATNLLQSYLLVESGESSLQLEHPYPPMLNDKWAMKLPPHCEQAVHIAEGLPYNLGTAFTYLWRAGKKSKNAAEDISKAIDHIDFEIERLKRLDSRTGKNKEDD